MTPRKAAAVTDEVSVDDLRKWLDRGKSLSLLDVRPAEERREWSVPGSVHVDAYRALWEGDPEALSAVDLPQDRPVVVICSMGKTSLLAAEKLREQGYQALSLRGGMKAWSLAWNTAGFDLVGVPENNIPDVRVIQFRRTGKGCLSYLVGCGGEAVVIDPSLDPDVYLAAAKSQEWRIKAVLDTHVHADHLSRARSLAQKAGVRVHLPETDRVSYPYQPLRDSEALPIGRAMLVTMRSPGHTPESACYRLDNRMIFTGDTLFTDTVGRPDLATSARGAERRAHALYRSIQKLLPLPGEILVLPCHTGKPVPFDKQVIGAPLGAVREALAGLPEAENAFVAHIMERIPPTPPNHAAIVKMNETGRFPEGDPTDLEAGANRCAVG